MLQKHVPGERKLTENVAFFAAVNAMIERKVMVISHICGTATNWGCKLTQPQEDGIIQTGRDLWRLLGAIPEKIVQSS